MSQDSQSEDELSSPSLTALRVTPRQAPKRSASEALTSDTPYTNLRRLAGVIRPTSTTPNAQRAPSTGAASDSKLDSNKATIRRYGASGVGKYPRPVPAKRSAPSTPHAIRALEQRRQAALTPSRERRRSGRQQRDSPRDVLRNLSRVLTAKAGPKHSAAPLVQEQTATKEEDDDDSRDFERSRPRLSLPIDVDDSVELPPEMSTLDEDLTQRSVEASRRALTEPYMQERTRLSEGAFATPEQLRQSANDPFGEVRSSLGVFADESIFQNERQGDETEDLRRAIAEERENATQDYSMQDDGGVPNAAFDDSTFRFDIPADLQPADEEDDNEEPALEAQAEEPPHEVESASQAEEEEGPEEPVNDPELFRSDSDVEMQESFAAAGKAKTVTDKTQRKGKSLRESRFGIPVPNLPTGVVKSIATSFMGSSGKSRGKLNKDAVAALVQAGNWYFEQLGEDLAAYSKHARRKTIDETDVVALMKRQRLLSTTSTPFSLAQKFLPRELLQQIRMAPPRDDR